MADDTHKIATVNIMTNERKIEKAGGSSTKVYTIYHKLKEN